MQQRKAALATSIFFVVAPFTMGIIVPWLISGWRLPAFLFAYLPVQLAGALLFLGGAVLLLDSFIRFVREGRGTPAPVLPTERLVVRGAYRYVRNPMYVGVTAAILGQAMVFASPALALYGLAFWAVCHLFVISYEEPTLQQSFGETYDTYRVNVPRWLPRRSPWPG